VGDNVVEGVTDAVTDGDVDAPNDIVGVEENEVEAVSDTEGVSEVLSDCTGKPLGTPPDDVADADAIGDTLDGARTTGEAVMVGVVSCGDLEFEVEIGTKGVEVAVEGTGGDAVGEIDVDGVNVTVQILTFEHVPPLHESTVHTMPSSHSPSVVQLSIPRRTTNNIMEIATILHDVD